MRFYSEDYAPKSQILLRFTLWIVHHKSSEWPGSRQKHSILLQGTKTNFFLKSRKNIAYFLYQGSKAQHNYPFTHDVLQSLGKPERGGTWTNPPTQASDDDDDAHDADDAADDDAEDDDDEDDDDDDDDEINADTKRISSLKIDIDGNLFLTFFWKKRKG